MSNTKRHVVFGGINSGKSHILRELHMAAMDEAIERDGIEAADRFLLMTPGSNKKIIEGEVIKPQKLLEDK